MNPKLKSLQKTIAEYVPRCEQEEADRAAMLKFISANDDCLLRKNQTAHFTASSWIVNEAGDKVLLVYHNIYDSWSWTGGHADGEPDLLSVAVKEAREETGISAFEILSPSPISLEILTVRGHEKNGAYVPSHLHMNLTFLLCASSASRPRVKEDENSGVSWFNVRDIDRAVREKWMKERIYRKLIDWKERI